jgi:predicted Zn-dependent protease
MKKFTLLFFLLFSFALIAQEEEDFFDDELSEKTEEICGFTNKKIEQDAFSYAEADKDQKFKIWYAWGSRDFKKWKATKKAELAKSTLNYYWQLVVADSNGTSIKGRTPRIKYAYQKMAQMYASNNQLDMLAIVLARSLAKFPNSSTLTFYAASYYMANGMKNCAIAEYEKVLKLSKKTKTKLRYLTSLITLYQEVDDVDAAIEACDRYLALENSPKIAEIKANLMGDPQEVFNFLVKKVKENPEDYDALAQAAKIAAREEFDDKFVISSYKKLLKKFPKNVEYRTNLVKVAFRNEQYKTVIAYGKSMTNAKNITYVIKAYIDGGKFKEAYNLAAKIGKRDRKAGHYLKGQVFENTARAAKDEFPKQDFEWRLIYRLAFIEYEMAKDMRKNKIQELIPTKGALFLKNERIKSKLDKYAKWIPWEKAYEKKVYGIDK